MAMTLRLDEADDKLLSERAIAENRSKQEIVKEAVHVYLTERTRIFEEAVAQTLNENAEIFKWLEDK